MSLAASITAAVGQLTGAAGTVIGGMSAGTAECGARPILKKNRVNWDACVARTQSIQQQGLNFQQDQQRLMPDESGEKKKMIYIVVAIVLIVIFFMYSRRQSN